MINSERIAFGVANERKLFAKKVKNGYPQIEGRGPFTQYYLASYFPID